MMVIDVARTMIAAALQAGRDHDMQPLAVIVLDGGGHVIAFEREDSASTMRFAVAHGKAFGALGLGVGSRTLMLRAEQQPAFITSVAAAFGGALVPVPGGVLVADSEGAVIGAVGVSGDTSDNDEIAAVAGIRSAGLAPITG